MILLDTNALMIPGRFHIDIFSQLDEELAVISPVIKELEQLSKPRGKKISEKNRNAQIALKLLKNKDINIIPVKEESVDKAILEYSNKHNCKVATNDKELIKELKKNNIKIIRLRQKKYLVER